LIPVENIENPRSRLARVERADLGRNIALEKARTQDQQRQRDQERLVERHRQVARAHQQHSDQHGALAAQDPVGDPAPGDRGEIDQARIEPGDQRGEIDIGQRSGKFQSTAQGGQAPDMPGKVRQQQLLDHVQRQQRLHAVERETLPHLGGGEVVEPARMTADSAVCCC
jgi:hypothetical protein